MAYAVSEKVGLLLVDTGIGMNSPDTEQCYRQCEPTGYVQYSVANLQLAFEQHYNGVGILQLGLLLMDPPFLPTTDAMS